jgi:hypothetical protein
MRVNFETRQAGLPSQLAVATLFTLLAGCSTSVALSPDKSGRHHAADDVAALARQVTAAESHYAAAFSERELLVTTLRKAQRVVDSAPDRLEHCRTRLDQADAALPPAREDLAGATSRLRAFGIRYPNFELAASKYVHDYSPSSRFGEAATAKAINEAVGYLNKQQQSLSQARQRMAARVVALEKDVAALRQSAASIREELEWAKERVAALPLEITSRDERVRVLNEDRKDLASRYAVAKARQDQLLAIARAREVARQRAADSLANRRGSYMAEGRVNDVGNSTRLPGLGRPAVGVSLGNQPAVPARGYSSISVRPPVAENGDYRNRDNDGDGRVESIHVRSYYRRDGTYVRGHYRAR